MSNHLYDRRAIEKFMVEEPLHNWDQKGQLLKQFVRGRRDLLCLKQSAKKPRFRVIMC